MPSIINRRTTRLDESAEGWRFNASLNTPSTTNKTRKLTYLVKENPSNLYAVCCKNELMKYAEID
ncbi:MAG: hypothetical protein PHX51_04235 [Clostridia bacterium]|nr:hypothetical protein [Clostridia bacterium]